MGPNLSNNFSRSRATPPPLADFARYAPALFRFPLICSLHFGYSPHADCLCFAFNGRHLTQAPTNCRFAYSVPYLSNRLSQHEGSSPFAECGYILAIVLFQNSRFFRLASIRSAEYAVGSFENHQNLLGHG